MQFVLTAKDDVRWDPPPLARVGVALAVQEHLTYAIALPFTYRNWWAVPLPKFGKNVALELRNGTKYLVRAGTTDLAAVNEAAILNPYLRSPYIVLPEDATVIDIGANIGDFTIQVARTCPRGRILAVEPVGAHVQMIEAQIALNQLSHVQTVRAAVGAACQMTRVTAAGTTSRVNEREDAAESSRWSRSSA